LDGKVHGGNANIDVLGFQTAALAPGLTAGVSYVDRGAVGATTGLTAGTTGAAAAQPSITFNLTYGAGPISARFDVTSWNRQGDTTLTSSNIDNRFRVSGNYNLGMAKVGLGYSSLKRTNGDTSKNTTAGISAPFGATTVGVVYEKNVTAGVTKTGYTVGAQYNLSKRTNVSTGYASWKTAGAASASTFRVLVGHSF
jgi:hypothetical protein